MQYIININIIMLILIEIYVNIEIRNFRDDKMNIKGKRILILGGTSATLDLVKNAKEMGVYTIVTDFLPSGVSKEIADEVASVSTTDLEGLKALIKERNVDGVFCGPSEFNIRNLLKLCEETGLPCYTNTEIWDHCANKDIFKQYCIKYGVDCPREYEVNENSSDEELSDVDFPVIVKPVDGHSSNGISVCFNPTELKKACEYARTCSARKKIIVEKYIDNGGEIFGARYIIDNGEAFPYLLIDTYVADPVNRKSLISHYTHAPSKYADYYMNNMDSAVRKMIKGMGIKNGTAFFQALPYNNKIYFHEMGYRLSGGMLFKFTVPLMGINDMKMMLRFALGGEMCTEEEKAKFDINCGNKIGAQLNIPLSVGTIASIEGLEELKGLELVQDFIQYYKVGDEIKESVIGTLGQHFGRFTIIANTEKEVEDIVKKINSTLFIKDKDGKILNNLIFDYNRSQNKQF